MQGERQPTFVGRRTRREPEPIWCYHGRRGPGHIYSPGEYCPPDGPVVDGDCPGCGAPRGYPPAGPYGQAWVHYRTAEALEARGLVEVDRGEWRDEWRVRIVVLDEELAADGR